MRWGWPFLIYAAVAVVHLVRIAFSSPGADVTKAMLMPALLLAVVLTAFWTGGRAVPSAPSSAAVPERAQRDEGPAGRRGWWAVGLLAAGIVASFLGDVLLGPSFEAGLASFAVAHLLYIVVFNGPARRNVIRWWSLGYIAVLVAVVTVLWPHLGELRPLVVGYGVVLALTAMTATRVNALTAWGGGLFLASDALLAFRLFHPGFDSFLPDPWQDLLIMALYCAGEGLIAFGVLLGLRTRRG